MHGNCAEKHANAEERYRSLDQGGPPHPAIRDEQHDAGQNHRREGDKKHPLAGNRISPAEQEESEAGNNGLDRGR